MKSSIWLSRIFDILTFVNLDVPIIGYLTYVLPLIKLDGGI